MTKLFEQLKDSLEEVSDFLDKKPVNVRISTAELKVSPLPSVDADTIKSLRIRLGLSQGQFADVIGVKKVTVSKWEQGVNLPTGSSLRLIEIISKMPDVLANTNIMTVG